MKRPRFWQKKNSRLAAALRPLGCVYAWSVARRLRRGRPFQADMPVVCVGNISVGGVGKTPVSLAVADFLKRKGRRPYFLGHGYKSRLQNVLVDRRNHSAWDVGDEALLLAEAAPTIVDRMRSRGAQLAMKHRADCLIMDDGFQNPSLIKTISLVVVDGGQGFGNELVLPAGPLREPVLRGLKRADAVVIAGEDRWGVGVYLKRHGVDLPVLTGRFVLNVEAVRPLAGQSVLAFAGLGTPRKFFDALTAAGLVVARSQEFPDHYIYTRFDIEQLQKKAGGLPLVTTQKDYVKIPADLQKHVHVVTGRFAFDDEAQLADVLREAWA